VLRANLLPAAERGAVRVVPIMGASNPQWKKTERQVARILGGRRRWLSRSERRGGGDIDHPRLEVEVKHVPKMGFRAARALISAMPADGKPRVVVHRAKGRHGAEAWGAYMDLADLWRLLGAAVTWMELEGRSRGTVVRLDLRDLARLARP
jgi:hypothetical protein